VSLEHNSIYETKSMVTQVRRLFGIYALVTAVSIDAFAHLSIPSRTNSAAAKSKTFQGKTDRTKLCAFEHIHSTIGVINKCYQTSPILSACVTCGVKASAADFVAQLNAEPDLTSSGTSETAFATTTGSDSFQENIAATFHFELPRNLAFLLYGVVYQGFFQHYLYNIWFPVLFGTSNDIVTVAAMVLFDTVLIVPIICLPLAYLTKTLISGGTVQNGIEKYVHDVKHTNLVLHFCAIWIPAKFLAFGVVAEHLRIPFFAFISFFWMIILSTISSSSASKNVK